MLFDAAVIGAGPAGAVTAQRLAAAGWRVALIEKNEFPRRKVCGEFISAPSFPILDSCGIGDAFRVQAGPPVSRIALFAGATMVTADAPGKAWGRALGREHLDLLLRDAAVLAGAVSFQPREAVTVAREDGLQRVMLDDGTVLTARALVAASGSWRVTPPFAVRAPERAADLLAFKGHFRGSALADGVMPLLAFPGGYGGMVHSDSSRLSLSCCIRRDVLTALRRPGERAGDTVLRHLRTTTRGIHEALGPAMPDAPLLAAGPIRPGIRPRYRDRVFFTGNLAGEAHPVIAEGISMAMQGGALLARHLITAGPMGNLDGAGTAYAADWLKRFGPRLAAAALFAHAAMGAPGLGTELVRRLPRLLTWGAAASGKTFT